MQVLAKWRLQVFQQTMLGLCLYCLCRGKEMKIEMPFNLWSKERLILGKKQATSRNKKYGDIGDTFIVGNWEYVIIGVTMFPLWFIRKYLYQTEGCDTPEEFVDIWNVIHPKKRWQSSQYVWYHLFEAKNAVEEPKQ